MEEVIIKWCTVHQSVIIHDPTVEGTSKRLCEFSNRKGSRTSLPNCAIVDATVIWTEV